MNDYVTAGFVFAKLALGGALILLATFWISARLEAARRRAADRSARARLELARRAAARVDAERRAPVTVVRTPPALPEPRLRRVS